MTIFDSLRYPISNIYDDIIINSLPEDIVSRWCLLNGCINSRSLSSMIEREIVRRALIYMEKNHVTSSIACPIIEDDVLKELKEIILTYNVAV